MGRGRRLQFTNIDLGYAGTIYRGQGKTLDQTYLLHTHHWRDAASYVAMTRARGQTEVFVGRDQASGLPALAKQMSRQSDRGATLQYMTQDQMPYRRQVNFSRLEKGQTSGFLETASHRPIRRSCAALGLFLTFEVQWNLQIPCL